MKHTIRLTAAALASTSAALAQVPSGPNSSATPYIVPTAAGWSVSSLLTVNDTATNGYRMVGIPDGLGAYDNGGGTIKVLMNHELGSSAGVARAHGATGAFVSEWTINKNTLAVTAGQDLISGNTNLFTWNGATDTWTSGANVQLNRLCSADLPSASAFFNSGSTLGYSGRIFMNGEESGAEGRAWGFVATGADAGKAYELPKLGRFSWENSVANAFSGDKTVVVGLDDTRPGQVYVYVGDKTNTGNAVEMAGLNNGQLYGVKVAGVTTETAAIPNSSFSLTSVVGGNSANDTGSFGAALQTESSGTPTVGLGQGAGIGGGKQITEFARPEDGAWVDADTFVFVVTGGSTTTSDSLSGQTGNSARLYRMDFSNVSDFTAGGTISMVLEASSLTGTDGQIARSFDNLAVGVNGKIYIQEDPGDSAYIAKIWEVDLNSPLSATQIFTSDTTRFISGAVNDIDGAAIKQSDEEHSGIIDVTDLFMDASWYQAGMQVFLGDTQAHYTSGLPNLASNVEGGQLQLMVYNPAAIPEPSSFAAIAGVLGLGLAACRRRRA